MPFGSVAFHPSPPLAHVAFLNRPGEKSAPSNFESRRCRANGVTLARQIADFRQVGAHCVPRPHLALFLVQTLHVNAPADPLEELRIDRKAPRR